MQTNRLSEKTEQKVERSEKTDQKVERSEKTEQKVEKSEKTDQKVQKKRNSRDNEVSDKLLKKLERLEEELLASPLEEQTLHLKEMLRPKRYNHTLGVVLQARKLARAHGEDEEKAVTAALLHDCAKHNERMYFEKYKEKYELKDALLHDVTHLHSTLGRIVAREEYGVEDEEILHAIRVHTTGEPEMTKLDMILYLADATEPGRVYPDVARIREVSMEDLEQALIRSMDDTIRYLLDCHIGIHTDTIIARNFYLEKERMRRKALEENK